MIYLLPWTLWPQVWLLALLLVCVFSAKRNRNLLPVVIIMLCNYGGTRIVTAFEFSPLVQAIVDLSSAIAMLAFVKGRELVVLPASALFALMVTFAAADDFGFLGRDTLWAWSDVLGYCQLLVIAGGAMAGGGYRRAGVADHRRHRDHRLGESLSARLQTPPPT